MTNNISCYQEPDPDAPDPDSDVPDELCFIFASYSDRNSVAELLFFQGNQENPTLKPSSALICFCTNSQFHQTLMILSSFPLTNNLLSTVSGCLPFTC